MPEYKLYVNDQLEAIVTEEEANNALYGARILFPGSTLSLVRLEDDGSDQPDEAQE